MKPQVVVAGAGPAGLAAATLLARRGLAVVVCERAKAPPDKPCGEGLMPHGVALLETLGVRATLAPGDCRPLRGVRWIQEDGDGATGRLPGPGGLGVRRPVLARALLAAASDAGVTVLWDTPVTDHGRGRDGVRVAAGTHVLDAELLVAADGLHSEIRRRAGLQRPSSAPRRFGVRRHYLLAPWSDLVEVHLAAGREAFVTPVAPDLVGVAFLWDPARAPTAAVRPHDALLAGFPRLAARLADAPPATPARGAGPLDQRVRATVARRLVLLGDAAGYRDAITGEGLSLAFAQAAALAEIAPAALARGADADALAPYAAAHARRFRRYALVTGAVLGLARRPRLRRPVVRALGRFPGALDRLVAWSVG